MKNEERWSLGPSPQAIMARRYRGHDLFVVDQAPAPGSTDDSGPIGERTVYARLFTSQASRTYYVLERDETELFGYIAGDGIDAELGYASVREYEELCVPTGPGLPVVWERDQHFRPTTLAAAVAADGHPVPGWWTPAED